MVGNLLLRIVAIAVVLWLLKVFVAGTPFEEAELLGLTQAQVRAEHGEPYRVIDFDAADNKVQWLYAHGFIGVASLVEFDRGLVVAVLVSYGK